MKINSLVKIAIMSIIVLSLFFTISSASVDPAIQNDSASSLFKLKVLTGYPDGSLGLQNKIKRSEFFTLVIRTLGYDKDSSTNDVAISFKDLGKTHWAYNNIKLAVKYKLVSGYPDHTIAPDNYVTYAEALTVLIRALGYENTLTGKWPESVLKKADQIGLNKNVDLPQNKQLTRGEMSVIVNNSLTIDYNR